MPHQLDYLRQAVNGEAPRAHRYVAIRDFAESLGWHPSYTVDDLVGSDDRCHLIVEHGLENAAALTFLPAPDRPGSLSDTDLIRILTISYNTLVDSHIILSYDEVLFAHNLFDPPEQRLELLQRSNIDIVSGFPSYPFLKPDRRPNIQNCEDQLIDAVSRWRRRLVGELRPKPDIRTLSALFNAIFFVRACEDYFSAVFGNSQETLFSRISAEPSETVDLSRILLELIKSFPATEYTPAIIDVDRLDAFRKIPTDICYDLINDFMRTRRGPYKYNFALMSKHALSRIYERYVSEMQFPEGERKQYSFLPTIPEEVSATHKGVVYTPQFIASFFARYLNEEIPPRVFRSMNIVDPACGSGIFLRTLLETQTVSLPHPNSEKYKDLFLSVKGVDIDENAIVATELSLSLLYLILTGEFPAKLNLCVGDAIDTLRPRGNRQELTTDLFIANPPFRKLDRLPAVLREKYLDFLGKEFTGRADSYLAFLKLALDNVREGGFVCFVLPHNFLFAKNARTFRNSISRNFVIHCLVDLSNVEVFEGVGAYVILLIIEKRVRQQRSDLAVRVGRISARSGEALQCLLDGTQAENNWYSCFQLPQEYFERNEWQILSPTDYMLEQKLKPFPKISEFFEVHQGFITGDDEIFIRPWSQIPDSERKLYLRYIPDRSMAKYYAPQSVDTAVFYPYLNGKLVTESELRMSYRETWRHLIRHKKRLTDRRAVQSGDTEWWRPVRSRQASHILRGKILTPHLCITPRFSIDLSGKLAPSRSPFFVVSKEFEPLEPSFLKLFTAFLNSSIGHWYITRYAFKYGKGYARLEVGNLKNFPVPNPKEIPSNLSARLLKLVEYCSREFRHADEKSYTEIDQIVLDIYGFTESEKARLREMV